LADAGVGEQLLELFEGSFVEEAAEFLECGAVGDGDINNATTNFDSAAVLSQFRADRFFPCVVQGIDGRAFQESAGADEMEHSVADGTWEPGDGDIFGGAWQV
jgi:hypothetical protein